MWHRSYLRDRIRAATVRDVAEHAGVSATTVSRSLRGMPTVAPATATGWTVVLSMLSNGEPDVIYVDPPTRLVVVEDLPDHIRRDPTWFQSGFADMGRDGCRVPLPWADSVVPFGFSFFDASSSTWLPQPPHWGDHTAEAQEADLGSFLNLYRAALAARSRLWDCNAPVRWLDAPRHPLAFSRGTTQCWVNTGSAEIELPAGASVMLASLPGIRNHLPSDSAVWLSVADGAAAGRGPMDFAGSVPGK